MSAISVILVLLTFFIALFNVFTIRRPKDISPVAEAVTVIVPMRNEAENVRACLLSLAEQRYLEQIQFLIIDDASIDETASLIEKSIAGDQRFSVISSPELRDGWLGKVSALQSGYERAVCDYLVTIDADVRLKPQALASAINQLKKLDLDFISPYPRQISRTFIENLIQPLLHWSWMSTVILRLAEKYPARSTAIANGQFFVARKEALDEIGGFTTVSEKILDDIEIARSLIKVGFRGIVTEGSDIAHTRMYSSFSQLRSGYGKSLWKAFGGPIGSVFAVALIFFVGIYPFILALNGYLLGIILYLLTIITRQMSALSARSNPLYAFAHPLSCVVLIYLIAYSWLMRGKIQWKGRTV